MDLLNRITLNPKVMNGKPTIRNMRFSVAQMLELLDGGMTPEEILEDYPYIEKEDIMASLKYAALIANTRDSWKLDLIEKLTQAIRQDLKTSPNTMKQAFGAWQSDESAEQIIQDLRESRNTHRQIESL